MINPSTAREAVASFSGDPGVPDVWLFDRTLPAFRALGERGPTSEGERRRAEGLARPGGGVDLLARRAALRRVLALYLGRAPEEVDLVTLPGGKPTLVPAPDDMRRLAFSSGVSDDLFCLAVGATTTLGVDIESLRVVPRARAIAERWFSEAEAAPIAEAVGPSGPGDEPDPRSVAFLYAWTGKEALAKRHSAGLRLLRRGRRELELAPEEGARRLVRFEPVSGYVAALAAPQAIVDLRVLVDLPLP